jgi:Flp pilus assembly protein TadD
VFYRAIRACGLCCFVWLSIGCARRPQAAIQRLAILRFENLTSDPATDWMGRAFAEVITSELFSASDIYAIPSSRLHTLNQAMGVRPISAPGISAEAPLAMAAGASRVGYGEYAIVGGRLRVRLTIEDPRTRRIEQGPIEAATGASDLVGAATAVARQISQQARPYETTNPAALEAFARAEEAPDADAVGRYAEQAVAAEPNFGMAYVILAELKAKHQDRAGMADVLSAAMRRGDAIPQSPRIRLEILAATLRGDHAGLERALSALVRFAPSDPAAWRAFADAAAGRRQYSLGAQAYERALAIEPEDATTWNQLGYTAAYAGSMETAMGALRRYRTLRPLDPNAVDSMGDVSLLGGRLKEAEGFYLEAYKKNPAFLGGGDLYKAAVARLMTGDVAGADSIAKQDALGSTGEWLWVSGHRHEAYAKLAAEAAGLGDREFQSRAYADLAMWALFLNDRDSAGRMAQKTAPVATPATAAAIAVARFATLPPAEPPELAARADRMFPNAPAIQELALAYAFLVNRQFQAAIPLLQKLEARSVANGDRATAIELAWALIETGNFKDAAPLLRWNPVPGSGSSPFLALYFPRLYQLRAMVAEREGRMDEARENRRIYAALGGE